MFVDPDGNFWGAAIAATFNVIAQLRRHDFRYECIDLVEVGISALIGSVFPGAVSAASEYALWGTARLALPAATGLALNFGNQNLNNTGPYPELRVRIGDLVGW
ncbi:MAG: hypothetical protein R3E83_13285 [Burkholderiaceae bacterium]